MPLGEIRPVQATWLKVLSLTAVLVCVVVIASALGLAVVPGLRDTPAPVGALPRAAAGAAASRAADHSRFVLNALLVPALDGDAVPLRWVDPRPAVQCGPDTTVRVDGAPLVPGALVPDAPFELEWQVDGCRPFGTHGPRLDGHVRLTVFREEWGFSAMVRPTDLRIGFAPDDATPIRLGAATLPQCVDPD